MADRIIEARVWQKVDTEANWLANPLPLGSGEQAFVSDKNNFKVNTFPTKKTFAELEYFYKGDVVGNVVLGEDLSLKSDGVYRPQTSGTYSGVVVKEGYYTLLRKSGNVWSLESEVKVPEVSVEGKVEEGNTKAVSGGEVYKSFLKKESPALEFGGISFPSGNLVSSTTRARVSEFQKTSEIKNVELVSNTLFITNIVYYNNGVFVSQEATGFVNLFVPTIPPTANQFRIVFSKNPNTTEITQMDIDNSKFTVNYNIPYDFESIDKFKSIKSDYDNAKFYVDTGLNELGGISISSGNNSSNNIRIRSANRVNVTKDANYVVTGIKTGYVLNRIIMYKDGVFYVSSSENPSLSFTPNDNYNEVRFVFSKTVNTDVITPEEVSSFYFSLSEIYIEKITEIAKRISEIPVIKNNLDSLKYGRLFGKTVSFLGDSITTYSGFIPVGNADYYPVSDVNSVTKTWWHKVIEQTGMVLEVNNSWSGSPISGTVARAFGSRIGNIGTPDVCFILGGTNDYTMGIPLGEWNYADNSFNKNVFKQAVQSLLYNLITTYPNTEFIVMTPLNRSDAGDGRVNGFPVNWNNEKFLADYQNALVEACSVYGVKCIDTREIFSYYNVSQYTIEGLHPKENGMTIIADWVVSKIL